MDAVPHLQPRDGDIARRLQERLVTDHHASLGSTLVPAADRAAHAAFQSWGWQDLGAVSRPPGATALRALVLPLGKRTAADPDGLAHDARTQRPA